QALAVAPVFTPVFHQFSTQFSHADPAKLRGKTKVQALAVAPVFTWRYGICRLYCLQKATRQTM
ncbi:MAG: hypothetical protein U1B83_01880, partial [Candidatus Cloacimonadaceae bacterium]|nr:hypothetical protein [Candidatus Cloacimonadaceae bacterium]